MENFKKRILGITICIVLAIVSLSLFANTTSKTYAESVEVGAFTITGGTKNVDYEYNSTERRKITR